MRAGWFAAVVTAIVAALSAAPALAQGGASPGTAPVIESVSPIAPLRDQTITIVGHGFGAQPPYVGDSEFIRVHNQSPSWNAGFRSGTGPDLVTLSVKSWTDGQIVLSGFAGDYGQHGWVLRPHGRVSFEVWNPQTHKSSAPFDVVVEAPAAAPPVSRGAAGARDSAVPVPPEAAYSGPPVGFLDHIHGVWRGVENCPNRNGGTAMELSLIQLNAPDKIGGIYHTRETQGFGIGDGPLQVGVDAKTRSVHIDLLLRNGERTAGFDAQLSPSGERLNQVNNTSGCEPIVLARQVDARAAGPGDGVPVITHISDLTATQHQRIVVSGHGFGTHAPIQGNSVVFAIDIHSGQRKGWNAGFEGDAPPDVLTVAINSWTDTEIQSTGFFTGYNRYFHLSPADKLTFYVWNPGTLAGPSKFDVTVTDYPPEADTAAIAPECKDRARAPEERVKACSALIAQQPGAAVFYRLRGVAWLKAGQFDAAMADFDKALELDPRMATALAGKGLVLSSQGKHKDAIAQGFSPALALDARLADVLWQRGLAEYSLGDTAPALADAEAALAIDARHFPALLLRGELLVEAGRYKDAADTLSAADLIDATNWRTDYFVSLALVGIGNIDAAQKAMTAACEANAPAELDACGKADEIAHQGNSPWSLMSVIIHRSVSFDVAAALAQFHQVEKP